MECQVADLTGGFRSASGQAAPATYSGRAESAGEGSDLDLQTVPRKPERAFFGTSNTGAASGSHPGMQKSTVCMKFPRMESLSVKTKVIAGKSASPLVIRNDIVATRLGRANVSR